MSAKNARLRRRCAKKVTYRSMKAAVAACNSLRTKTMNEGGNPRALHAYKCPYCTGFHVGHVPGRVRQSIAARRSKG